jgi:hypothetical protein
LSVILDAGALIAVERGDRTMMAVVKREQQAGRVPLTHGGVVGQVWRGGNGHQATVARLLAGVDVRAIDDALGRRAGSLLGASGSTDVIASAVVVLSDDGDEIFTSDPKDLRNLAQALGRHVDLIKV